MSSRKRRKRRPSRRPAADAAAASPADAGASRSARTASRRRAATGDERPPAPWGNVPLVELAVLIGIVLLVAGFIVHGSRGTAMVAAGLALCSIAGLELSIREHFGGYRSHTFLLSGAVAVAVLAGLALLTSLWLPLALAIAGGAFAATAVMLTRAFQRRSGRAFKIR